MNNLDFLDIVDIASQYVQLAPEGESHYGGTCPFCSAGEGLIISADNQYWCCLACGADGDRYDFVAKSENISRAEAILLVAHHTNGRLPFPHARFSAQQRDAKQAEVRAPQPAAPPQAAAAPESPKDAAGTDALPGPFLGLRNIIPSYQGAAVFDSDAALIESDQDAPMSADLPGVGALLAPILAQADAVFASSGTPLLPATVTLSTENSAILVHKFNTDKVMFLVVRLANPADAPMARRLVISACAKKPA